MLLHDWSCVLFYFEQVKGNLLINIRQNRSVLTNYIIYVNACCKKM